MCGIAGIFAHGASSVPVEAEELLRIREAMAPRGPDGSGLWLSTDRRVGLAHRRLAIIDLSEAAAQPMSSDDGALAITFNGEIYNYRELRAQLESRSHRFHTDSDTEVLLHLYQEHGSRMVDYPRGMFAFAIWDERKKGIFLARDPFGIKPLYYAENGGTLRFASQVKALVAASGVDTRRDAAGLAGFYLWGSVPEPYTLHRGIRALPSGSTLWLERGEAPAIERYFNIAGELSKGETVPPKITREEMRERLRSALIDSVRHHLVADVPVGVFLSAGLDSTSVMALAQEIGGHRISSLTLGFKEYEGTADDEVPLAALVAARYGTLHLTHWLTRDDFLQELEHLRLAMDQPSVDGVNTFFVSRAAAQAGMKVALSGLGGDELFGGYPSFTQIPRLVRAVSPIAGVPGIGRAFRYVSAPWLGRFTSPKYSGVIEYGGDYGGAYLLRRGLFMPWELPRLMGDELAKEGWDELQPLARLERSISGIGTPRSRIAALELQWYMRNQLLRDADWAGMAWSLEIRVPLVDVNLFRTVASLMGTAHPPGKSDMALAVRPALPDAYLSRKKTGFSIPTMKWIEQSVAAPRERGLRGWARMLVGD